MSDVAVSGIAAETIVLADATSTPAATANNARRLNRPRPDGAGTADT
jgi:hypothetical protein